MRDNEPNIPERWHGAHHYSNRLNIFLVFFLIFAALSFLWFYMEMNKLEEIAGKVKTITPTPTQSLDKPQAPGVGVACTMEAKACPDGVNFVGRTAPNCDFQACPGEHCGGNIKNAATCLHGYHCQLSVSTPDTGGTCVKD